MTTLMDDLRLAVREIWQSMGFGESANAAATVVPVLLLGVALNLIALGVVDRVHPFKGKTQVVGVARAECRLVQRVTARVLRQIEGRERGLRLVKRWASCRLAEMVKCGVAIGLDSAGGRNRSGFAFPCGDSISTNGARKTLRAI